MNIKTRICSQITTGILLGTSLLLSSTQKASAYESTKLYTSSNVTQDSYEQCREKASNIANSVLTRSQFNDTGNIYYVAGEIGESRATIRCIQMPKGTAVTVTAHTCRTICPASGCESKSIVNRLEDFMYK